MSSTLIPSGHSSFMCWTGYLETRTATLCRHYNANHRSVCLSVCVYVCMSLYLTNKWVDLVNNWYQAQRLSTPIYGECSNHYTYLFQLYPKIWMSICRDKGIYKFIACYFFDGLTSWFISTHPHIHVWWKISQHRIKKKKSANESVVKIGWVISYYSRSYLFKVYISCTPSVKHFFLIWVIILHYTFQRVMEYVSRNEHTVHDL